MARSGMLILDTLGPALNIMVVRTAVNVSEAMGEGAVELQAYAQANAPWADQTGAARDGLVTDVFEEGGEIVIELSHSVDYGVWLELIQNGNFAIIMPTLEALGPRILRDAGSLVTDIRGAS